MKKLLTTIVIMVLAIFSSFGQGGWTTEDLTTHKLGLGSANVGPLIFFGGGLTSEGVTNLVEIYNIETQAWTYDHLSVARNFSIATSNGSKVFFAGGLDNLGTTLDVVEIFDTATTQWTVAPLSQAVFALSALSKGNKVLFAGGGDFTVPNESDKVNIYNTITDSWTTDLLSEARASMGAAVVGDEGLFAGGLAFSTNTATDKVDIYNFSTGAWSMARLSEARFAIAATTVGDKVIFAGGERADGTLSNRVDVYDYTTKTWAIDSISVARGSAGAATVCGKAYFIGGMKVNVQSNQIIGDFKEIDIYDPSTEDWSVELLPYNLFAHSTIAVDTQLFIAGGGTISGEFIQLRNVVHIFNCVIVGTDEVQSSGDLFTIYPNPAIGSLYIQLPATSDKVQITVRDMAGTLVYRAIDKGYHELEVNTSDFAEGIYVVTIQSGDFVQSQKVMVVK